MGAIDEKLESTSTKAVNSDTESTTRSIIPPLQQIVEPVPDVAGALNSPTRSRRPTLVKDPLELFPQPWRSVDSVLEPAASEKWTANRIANASWAYITTWKGFLITFYMLNIIAWGGMLFLLLVNAAPGMCNPSCNDINSGRRIWIEIDSQILNALFCVTGLGLLPWRLRDGYVLYRGNWERLSRIHGGWYIHGVTQRALMYWVVILFLANSAWQIAMASCMWSMDRYVRPAWCIGITITAGFLCAIGAGGIEFWEVRRRKKLQKLGKIAPAVDIVESYRNSSDRKLDAEQLV